MSRAPSSGLGVLFVNLHSLLARPNFVRLRRSLSGKSSSVSAKGSFSALRPYGRFKKAGDCHASVRDDGLRIATGIWLLYSGERRGENVCD